MQPTTMLYLTTFSKPPNCCSPPRTDDLPLGLAGCAEVKGQVDVFEIGDLMHQSTEDKGEQVKGGYAFCVALAARASGIQ